MNAWWCCTSSKAASSPCASINSRRRPPAGRADWDRAAARRVPLKEIVHFTQELAALLKAGLPLDRSLQALQEVTHRPAMKDILSQVLRDLQGGKTLSDSLARHRVFSSLYVSLVEAGETGGFLDEALDRLGDYLKTVSEFRSYLLTALIYPVILGGGGVPRPSSSCSCSWCPASKNFFKEMGQNLFWTTSFLMSLSHGLALLLVVAAGC